MKKNLLLAFLALSAFSFAFAQGEIEPQLTNVQAPTNLVPYKSYQSTASTFIRKNDNLPYKFDTIGNTYYDLQTNASIGKRLYVHADGKISVAWTFSPDGVTGFPLRGSGYNHYNGSTWATAPTSRVETNERLGWPSIGLLPGGIEYMIAHHATDGGFNIMKNNAVGGTTWTTSNRILSAAPAARPIWNRSDNNGNIIHLISNYSDSTATTHPNNIRVNGLLLPATYSRSKDGGTTWDKALTILPGYDTTRYVRGGGDQYAIDVNGSTLAIVIADNLGGDVAMWKSTDDGETFTKTIVDTFAFAPYTADKIIGSNVSTNDGSVDVVVDANGNAHVFWGYSEVTRNHVDTSLFVPGSNRIMYWNEQTNNKTIIGGMLDMNGDNTLSLARGTTATLGANDAMPTGLQSVARYGNTSLATMPSAMVDAQGRIFCIYSAPFEGDVYLDDTLGSSNYRDIYITFSTDNGNTWADPQNIVQGIGYEDVFGCIGQQTENGNLHVIWQRDEIPGTNLQNNSSGNSHPTLNNTILHATIPVQAVINNQIGLGPGVSVAEVDKQNVYITTGFYPNPTSNGGEIDIFLTETSNVTLTVSNLLGQTMATQNLGKTAPGNTTVNVNTDNFATGVYMYTISTDKYSVSGKMVVNK